MEKGHRCGLVREGETGKMPPMCSSSQTRALPALVAVLLMVAGPELIAAPTPQRIASLAPNLTAMVQALGAGDRLVAVTPYCEASSGLRRLRGGMQPDPEELLETAPDLVLASGLTPPSTVATLRRLGLQVEVVSPTSLTGIDQAMQSLAGLLGVKPPRAEVPPPAPTVRRSAVVLFGAETTFTAARGSHAHEILQAAGLSNLAAEAGTPWPQVGEEWLLAADPEVLVVAEYGALEGVGDFLRRHRLRRHLRAVREGRVVVIPAPLMTVPGPGALQAASMLREVLP